MQPIRFTSLFKLSSLALFVSACASRVLAQAVVDTTAAEPALELAPFKVTSEGAQSVLHITQRDLEQRQANDLEDALSLDPSITVGGSTGVAQKIYVRNLGEGLINISLDGATQSGSLFHHVGRIAVEPELLKQIEVQPGTGNAADGPGALGGAIRFITKDATDLLQPGEQGGALLKFGAFSNTEGWKASATGYGRTHANWSGLVSVVVSDHDNIEDGHGNSLAGSNSRQEVVLGKVTGTFGQGHAVRLGFENLDESGDRLRRPEWAPGPANPPYYMESSRQTATLGYGFRPDIAGWLDLSASLSYTNADILQIGPWGPYEGAIESLQLDLRNNHRLGDRHTLIYGVDHRADEVAAGPDTDPRSVTEDSTVSGAFLQGSFAATERLTLNLGARVDSYRLDDRQQQSFDDDGFSPNAGLTFAITPELSLIASATTAFRGAQIADAFRVDIHRNDPDLQPEKARNYELRLNWRRAGFQFETGAYANRIEDIVTNTLPWSSLYTNAGELETDGFFVRTTYAVRRANFSLQYNHADTTIDGQIATRYQYSSLVSRIGDTWVADASWRPIDPLDVGWNVRLVQGLDDILVPENITGIPGTYIQKPGYTTHDFYLRWAPPAVKFLTINFTVKNVFDKYYLSHGSVENLSAIPDFDGVVGAPEPGRDIRLSASLRF